MCRDDGSLDCLVLTDVTDVAYDACWQLLRVELAYERVARDAVSRWVGGYDKCCLTFRFTACCRLRLAPIHSPGKSPREVTSADKISRALCKLRAS